MCARRRPDRRIRLCAIALPTASAIASAIALAIALASPVGHRLHCCPPIRASAGDGARCGPISDRSAAESRSAAVLR